MRTVRDILTRTGHSVVSGPAQTPVGSAVRKMAAMGVGAMVVMQGRKICGIFTGHDLLFRVVGLHRRPNLLSVGEVMSSPVFCCRGGDDIRTCANLLLTEDLNHLVVVEESRPVGLIGLRDILLESAGDDTQDDCFHVGANPIGCLPLI